MSTQVTKPRVKHLRLFGCRLNPNTVSVHWILRYAGHYDSVEHLDVNVIASEHMTESYRKRNRFQVVPFLEVTFDGTGPCPFGAKKVSDLTPWKEETPCTTQTAAGETIAEPNDRVLSFTEGDAICTFFAEHFQMKALWNPRSLFQRCRVVEVSGHTELLARRLMSMVLVMLFSKAAGTSDDEVVTGIAAHERELLWSFRIMEDMLTRSEEAAAHAVGLDYQELLAIGEREIKEQEAARAAEAELAAQSPAPVEVLQIPPKGKGGKKQREGTSPSDATTPSETASSDHGVPDKSSPAPPRYQHPRPCTSPTLVALESYIAGRALSIADFVVTGDLQTYPYLQSWLPSSLKQARFPAIIRYLERMRSVHGYEEALRPRLSFMKVFRRRPKIMAGNPLMNAHAHRLREMLDRVSAVRAMKTETQGSASLAQSTSAVSTTTTTKGLGTAHTAPQHNQSTPAGTTTNVKAPSGPGSNAPPGAGPEVSSKPQARGLRRFGRGSQWAPRLAIAPLCNPCTLSEKDEEALRCSERPVKRTTAQSVTGRGKYGSRTPISTAPAASATTGTTATLTGPASATVGPGQPTDAGVPVNPPLYQQSQQVQLPPPCVGGGVAPVARASTAQPRSHAQRTVWRHDPYRVHLDDEPPARCGNLPVVSAAPPQFTTHQMMHHTDPVVHLQHRDAHQRDAAGPRANCASAALQQVPSSASKVPVFVHACPQPVGAPSVLRVGDGVKIDTRGHSTPPSALRRSPASVSSVEDTPACKYHVFSHQQQKYPTGAAVQAQQRVRSTPPKASCPSPCAVPAGISAACSLDAPPMSPLPMASFVCSSVPQSLAVGHLYRGANRPC